MKAHCYGLGTPFQVGEGGRREWREARVRANLSKFRGLAKGLSQSVLALSFNLGGLAAGALIAAYFNILSSTPWSLLIYPGILSVRGAIGGLFSGRMSTALHLGTIRPSILNNTLEARSLFYSIITLTFISSAVMGLIASLFSALLMGATVFDAVSVLLVVIATMGFSILLISPITFGVSVLSYRRGLDPDVVVYPVISTVADIIVTVCYLMVLNSLFSSPQQRWSLLVLIDLFFLSMVCYLVMRNIRDEGFTRTIKEFILTLLLVSLIVNFTGSLLEEISHSIGNRPEIYAVYPALIDTIGDVGSIVGSTATTRMALGSLSPSLSSMKKHLREISSAWSASVVMFGLFSVVSSSLYGFGGLKSLFFQLITVNLLTTPTIIVISLTVAILTRRKGWDPDNFLIPIETSLADGATTLSLLVAITIIVA